MSDMAEVLKEAGAGLLSDLKAAAQGLEASLTPEEKALVARILERSAEIGAKLAMGQGVSDFDMSQAKFQRSALSDAAGQVVAGTINAVLMRRGQQIIRVAAALGGIPLPPGIG